jgi:glutathione S-transferase
METPMPENDDLDAQVQRMLNKAMGGLTPHQVLVQTSLAEAANVAERATATARNRERALKLLAALEKQGS